MINVSVIIATQNRLQLLKKTIASLLKQSVDGFELVIVDDGSTDGSARVLESYEEKYPHKIRYFYKDKEGVSAARNFGIKQAKGDLLIFFDDDVVIDKNTLASMINFYEETNFDAMGGRILPDYPHSTPQWIIDNKDLLRGPIVCHDYGEDSKLYEESMTPFVGACIAVTRDTFKKCGLFDESYGHGSGSSGEDSELFKRIKEHHGKIYYCGKALVWHPVTKERMTYQYIAKYNIGMGRYLARFEKNKVKNECRFWFRVPRFLIKRILRRIVSLFGSLVNKTKFLKNWSLFFKDVGMLIEFRRR